MKTLQIWQQKHHFGRHP